METEAIALKTVIKASDKYRCMIMCSVNKAIGKWQLGGQINGNFQTELLKGETAVHSPQSTDEALCNEKHH